MEIKEARMVQDKMRVFLPVGFLLLVWACAGPAYFDLHLENPENPGVKIPGKVLLVEDVEINQTYQDQRIVYRESPFQVKYYSFRFWSKSPDDLVEDAVVDFWRKSRIFKKVNTYGSGGDADLTMRMKIDAIEQFYFQKNWYARLAMDMEIMTSETWQPVLSHSFDRKMRLKGSKARFLAEKISEILTNELSKIAEEFIKKKPLARAEENDFKST
jgi:ABC-type uncharacterized transport system auxiliary subunit